MCRPAEDGAPAPPARPGGGAKLRLSAGIGVIEIQQTFRTVEIADIHHLRHAGATWAAIGGATLKELIEHLGHASARAAIVAGACVSIFR